MVRVVERDEFLAGLRAAEPLQTRVRMHERLIDDEQLFGDFVPSRLGGSAALLMLSGARSSGSVELRNPVALRLDLLDSEEHSLAAHRAAGTVLCRAVGLTASAQPNWSGFEDPHGMQAAWLSIRPSHGYAVAMELSAPLVDPPVWIPVGQVFQQTSVNGVQTLAVSQATNVVVQPGSTVAVVTSAWCLNDALASPSGQLMQSTPFRVRNDPRTSQADVWVDRDSLMAPT